MKSTSTRQSSLFRILNIVGIILILSSLIDYVFLIIPPTKPNNLTPQQWDMTFLQWQQSTTSQLIDHGIISMVGLAILFLGFWIERNSDNYQKQAWQEVLKISSLVLSGALGLGFILVILLNFNSLRGLNEQNIKAIDDQATQTENAIKKQSEQLGSLLQDNQKLQELDQAIKSGKVQGEQLVQLRTLQQRLQAFKGDPKALKQEVDKAQSQILTHRKELGEQAQTQFLKSVLKNALSGSLLTIGYMAIAWLGLTSMGSPKSSRR